MKKYAALRAELKAKKITPGWQSCRAMQPDAPGESLRDERAPSWLYPQV